MVGLRLDNEISGSFQIICLTFGKPRIRLNSPCLGLNPIIDTISIVVSTMK